MFQGAYHSYGSRGLWALFPRVAQAHPVGLSSAQAGLGQDVTYRTQTTFAAPLGWEDWLRPAICWPPQKRLGRSGAAPLPPTSPGEDNPSRELLRP
jgi:hypothetical protein